MNRTRTLISTLIALAVVGLSFSTIITPAFAQSNAYFYDKGTVVAMFKNLYDQHPGVASYESVGKGVDGSDIWLFKIGNASGGRILWDGDIHGWEDIGSIIEYYFANWLLASGDPVAQKIVANNYIMFIPVVNYATNARQNMDYSNSQYGVDINRNFVSGWSTSDPNNAFSYSGPYPASEPETQAMRYVFQTYHPNYYVNTHYGGEPVLESDYGNTAQISSVFNRINQLSNQLGWSFPYRTEMYSYSSGYAVADAASFGANAFLFEVANETAPIYTTGNCFWHTAHTITDIQNYFFPKTLPILIAMAEVSGGWSAPLNYAFVNNNRQPQTALPPTPAPPPSATMTPTQTSTPAPSSEPMVVLPQTPTQPAQSSLPETTNTMSSNNATSATQPAQRNSNTSKVKTNALTNLEPAVAAVIATISFLPASWSTLSYYRAKVKNRRLPSPS